MRDRSKAERALAGLQDKMDAAQNHDKYLYDLKDFSGAADPTADSDMLQVQGPPVPPDPENPDKPTEDHLTIDARTKGAFASLLKGSLNSCSGSLRQASHLQAV